MASRAKREAHRRYGLTIIHRLMNPSTEDDDRPWQLRDLAAVLNHRGAVTPRGTTDWDANRVGDLLYIAPDSAWLGWEDWERAALREENPLSGGPQAQQLPWWPRCVEFSTPFDYYGNDVFDVCDALMGRNDDDLPPWSQRDAYRLYAWDLVQDVVEGQITLGDLAAVLTAREIPTPDGHRTWKSIQVQRLLKTGGEWAQVLLSQLTTDGEQRDVFPGLASWDGTPG